MACFHTPRLIAQTSPFSPTPRSIAELKEAAEKGNPTAQFALANAYLAGEGVNADAAEAARWFRKAADQKDSLAQFALGMMFDEGKGVNKDKAEAARWYRSAAELGLPEAQYNLGTCYSKGEGVEKNLEEAVRWFRKAAEQGDIQGQVATGLALRDGKGVEKSPTEAARWLRKAAYQGEPVAQFFLGLAFVEGQGVESNRLDGIKWIRRAADQGHLEAQFFMGTQAGVSDLQEARKWLVKSVAAGHEPSVKALGELDSRIASAPSGANNASSALTSESPSKPVVDTQPSTAAPAPIEPATPFPSVQAPSSSAEVTNPKDESSRTGLQENPGLSRVLGVEPAERKTEPAQTVDTATKSIAVIVAASSLLTTAIAVIALIMFRQRLNHLSRELSQTRRELTKANENLGVMVNFLEKRLSELQAASAGPNATLAKAQAPLAISGKAASSGTVVEAAEIKPGRAESPQLQTEAPTTLSDATSTHRDSPPPAATALGGKTKPAGESISPPPPDTEFRVQRRTWPERPSRQSNPAPVETPARSESEPRISAAARERKTDRMTTVPPPTPTDEGKTSKSLLTTALEASYSVVSNPGQTAPPVPAASDVQEISPAVPPKSEGSLLKPVLPSSPPSGVTPPPEFKSRRRPASGQNPTPKPPRPD